MPMESDWMRGMEQIIIVANRSPAPPGTMRDMFGGHTTLIGSAVSSGEGCSHSPVNHILPPIPLVSTVQP
ncbi:hypothetical protein HYDPIDRAFT_117658 [Hydnomerulius pinastri MD-312]|uniref:Uncharacterized protein n=1 Tax=Hydnomerulius pinastri MD-312 TaxID=994086 RepID=A0A0C9W224_9AGAM|nr:hypothetical protein HYDPIDRAFT_117658 [Hydnomerulius pinastri MD-312]